MHLTGARRAPPLPFPRAPIKRSPRAPPSPHRSQPPLSSLARAQFAEAPPSSSSPVSRPPLLPSPLLVQRAIRLAYQLHHIAMNSERYSPTPIPRPKLTDGDSRRGAPPPPHGQPPPRPPLAKLSPPLGSPDPPHAKATTHCPRTGPPAANRRRAHRRPGFSPEDSRFAPPSARGAVPPPPALSLACGPAATASSPSAPAPSPALGRSWAGALAHAAPGWARNPPRPTSAGIPFLFPFSNLFSFN
jgi:hypothetical protein